MVNGNDIYIAIGLSNGTAPFACTKSNEIQVESEKIPISSPNTGQWKEHIVGRKEWGFTVSWLFGKPNDIKNLLMSGKDYTITVYGLEGSNVTPLLQGKATCMTAKATLTRGNIANGSFSFDGNGELYVQVQGITLSPQSLSVDVGDTAQITAVVTPSDASHSGLVYESSDPTIVTVDNSGLVTGIAQGTVTITCSATDGSGVTATCQCQVNAVPVSGITLSPSSLSIVIGGTSHITPTIAPSSASNKNVSWATSDSTIATVDGNGNVSGVAVGTCTITCSATDGSGVTQTCEVTVSSVAVTDITLSQNTLSLYVGGSGAQLTATVAPPNASNPAVLWSSTDSSVASVDAYGNVTPVGAGTCTIRCSATDGSGVYADCACSVSAQPPAPIDVTTLYGPLEGMKFDSNLYAISDNKHLMTKYIPVSEGDTITYTGYDAEGTVRVVGYTDQSETSRTALLTSAVYDIETSFVIPSGINYIRCEGFDVSLAPSHSAYELKVLKQSAQ